MSDKTSHQNSRIVYLRRTRNFLDSVQKDAAEFMSMSRKAVGSYWKSVTSKAVGSGLDFNETEILLPLVIDREATDRDFREKVKEFYMNLMTHVEYGETGTKLEIGLLIDNDQPVGKVIEGLKNMPIEPMDYIRYRHAMGHPLVAMDRESSIGDPSKQFYIYDPEVADKKLAVSTKLNDEAMIIYLKIKDEPKTVYDLLLVLGIDPRDYEGPNQDVLRTTRLREVAEKEPARLLKSYKTDNFEIRVKIQGLLTTGILKQVGNSVFESSTNSMVGKTVDDVVNLLQTDEFSEKLSIWMANYQDIIAKPKKARKKTVA